MFNIKDIIVVRLAPYASFLSGEPDEEVTEWVQADCETEEEAEEYLDNLNSYSPIDDYGRPFKYRLAYS